MNDTYGEEKGVNGANTIIEAFMNRLDSLTRFERGIVNLLSLFRNIFYDSILTLQPHHIKYTKCVRIVIIFK